MGITLPPNTSFYITDITTPVRWCTVEVGRTDSIHFRINGLVYSASKCFLLEGNYSTTTLVNAMCDVAHAHDPFDSPAGAVHKRFEPHANLVNNTVSIYIYIDLTSSNY